MKKKSLETDSDSGGKCIQRKKAGARCNARPMEHSEFCFFHDPARAKERARAQRAGGLRNRAVALPSSVPDAPLADLRDVVRLVADTINQVRRGEIDPRIANSVGFLAGILIKAWDRGEFEARLKALESAVKPRGSKPEYSFEQKQEDP